MSPEVLASVVDQAAELGVSVIVIAGGEPLVRQDEIFALAKAHPRILFPVFTNGLLIDDAMAAEIAACRNIVPVISFEGFREDTDTRRGSGVYDRLLTVCARLNDRNVFFGCSVTTTRKNFDHVTGEAFIRQMTGAGARVFTFVEYVPMAPGTENLVLTHEQKKTLQAVLADFNQKFPALFIGFPGDEDTYGGCLAAGRGFVHVSPSGDLEPCPAAPYSDANLATVPLKEALQVPAAWHACASNRKSSRNRKAAVPSGRTGHGLRDLSAMNDLRSGYQEIGLTIHSKKILKLTIGGGMVFWATTIATSLLPIAAEYRAAYSDWSIQTVWVGSLPMGMIIGFFVSFILLRNFDRIPSKNPILKSGIISFIALIIAVILIDVPQSFFGMSNSPAALYYFLIGVMFNGARFLLLGIVIGYLYNKRTHSLFKETQNEFNQ